MGFSISSYGTPKNRSVKKYQLYRRIPMILDGWPSSQQPCVDHRAYQLFFGWRNTIQIALLRVTPTMTFIRFVTGKSSGILSDISSGILSGISSGILSGISSGISSGILPGISSAICSGISSGILSDILSGISSGKSSGILSGKHSGTLSGISSGILSDILSGISSGILSGRWGPAAHTELGRSQVEVQQCTLICEGPRLRSSGAHWARTLAKSLAKSWQGNSGRGSGGRGGGGDAGGGGAGGAGG